MTPLVSVTLPCYRQLDLLHRSLDSIRAQTFTNLEITLLDDGSSDEYREYVADLGDSRVRYHRNEARLGAMNNMFAAITRGRGDYTMAFHEDDLLLAGYIATAVGIMETTRSCGFVSCQLREFTDEPTQADLKQETEPAAYEQFESSADFVRGVLRGAEPMFGSVVYRRTALADVQPDHETYATLVDRPFLLSIMGHGWTAAHIRDRLVWYRHHGEGDTRHLAMTSDHVLNLLRTYKSALQGSSKEDAALFFSYSGYWLFELYRLTPPGQRPPVWKFLLRAWRQGLYNPRARGRYGVRQIQRALLNRTS